MFLAEAESVYKCIIIVMCVYVGIMGGILYIT